MTVADLIRILGDMPKDAVVVVNVDEMVGVGAFRPLNGVDQMSYDGELNDAGPLSGGFEGEPCAVLWPDWE